MLKLSWHSDLWDTLQVMPWNLVLLRLQSVWILCLSHGRAETPYGENFDIEAHRAHFSIPLLWSAVSLRSVCIRLWGTTHALAQRLQIRPRSSIAWTRIMFLCIDKHCLWSLAYYKRVERATSEKQSDIWCSQQTDKFYRNRFLICAVWEGRNDLWCELNWCLSKSQWHQLKPTLTSYIFSCYYC